MKRSNPCFKVPCAKQTRLLVSKRNGGQTLPQRQHHEMIISLVKITARAQLSTFHCHALQNSNQKFQDFRLKKNCLQQKSSVDLFFMFISKPVSVDILLWDTSLRSCKVNDFLPLSPSRFFYSQIYITKKLFLVLEKDSSL